VGKERESKNQRAQPASETPPAGALLRRFKGIPRWLRANPRRGSIGLGVTLVAIIGVGWSATLGLRPAARPAYMRQLAGTFVELDKENYGAARQAAARLLSDASVGYADHGGAYYVLGAVTLHDADEQINAGKRQVLNLIAARYLEEARTRGLPPAREHQALWMLGRALHGAGRYARSITVLREALNQPPDDAAAIHALLADCYLRLQPPKLAEALEHNRQHLASSGLTPRQLDDGRLIEAQILLAQQDIAGAETAARLIEPSSPDFPESLVLQGRIALARLANGSPEQAAQFTAQAAQMQEQLRSLMAADGLPPSIAAKAQLLMGLFYQALGDLRAATAQYDHVRRLYFGQPEAVAATIFHADLVRSDNVAEAVALYKRALSQLGGFEASYDNLWLPAEEFRARLSAAIDYFTQRGNFAEALELAESLVAPFSQQEAIQRQAKTHRTWAQQLEERATQEKMPQVEATLAEARAHRRQAGALWRKMAGLRVATEFYIDDLAQAADDFRRGHGFAQAVAVYRELLAQEPRQGEPEGLVGLGESLLALGKIDEAFTVLTQCRDAYPRHPATYQARLLSSQALEEQGKLAEAQELLIDNLYRYSLAPQSADWRDSLFALGTLLYRQAMELEGRSRLAGVDRLDPESRRSGLALLEQSHAAFEEAIRTLTEAVERYPTAPQSIEARYRIAEGYRQSAKLPRKRMANVTIETSRALLNRQMQEHLQAAIDGYSGLITRLSDQQDAHRWPTEAAILRNCYFGRADALFDLGQYEAAIQAYSAATNRYQHDPESLEAYVQIASCHRRLGRVAEARGTLEQARVVLQRIRPDADFVRTTRLGRQDWVQLLDWLRTL
jgi:tetratricopeptide (TPR) repeat protein